MSLFTIAVYAVAAGYPLVLIALTLKSRRDVRRAEAFLREYQAKRAPPALTKAMGLTARH